MGDCWQYVTTAHSLRAAALAVALLAGLGEHSAWAGPPLITDDPETPGRGVWEINISHNIERTKEALLMETPLFDINYGLLENDQWKMEFPVLYLDSDEHGSHWGMGDLLLGWKYRFLDEGNHPIMASVYPQLLVPIANKGIGLGDGRVEALFPMQFGKHFVEEQIFVYGEFGYNVVSGESRSNSWIYGLAVSCEATKRFEVMAEIGGVVFDRDGEVDDTFFNVGFKYDLTRQAALIGSCGRSLHGVERGTPDLLTFLGVQLMLGGDRRSSEAASGEHRDPVSGREARLLRGPLFWR